MRVPEGPMLELVLPVDVDNVALATACVETARGAGVSDGQMTLYGRPISSRGIARQLGGKETFLIEAAGFHAHLARITDFRHAYLTVRGLGWSFLDQCAVSVSRASPLISGRWIDAGYDYWQNATDPLLFQVTGRSTRGLSTRSNNLPPPLTQMIIDISKNPGRRILRDGYVEAVGHRMWLAPEFFRRVPGVSKLAIMSSQWLRTHERPDGILEILARDQPFVDGSAAELESRLRGLLFPATAPAER